MTSKMTISNKSTNDSVNVTPFTYTSYLDKIIGQHLKYLDKGRSKPYIYWMFFSGELFYIYNALEYLKSVDDKFAKKYNQNINFNQCNKFEMYAYNNIYKKGITDLTNKVFDEIYNINFNQHNSVSDTTITSLNDISKELFFQYRCMHPKDYFNYTNNLITNFFENYKSYIGELYENKSFTSDMWEIDEEKIIDEKKLSYYTNLIILMQNVIYKFIFYFNLGWYDKNGKMNPETRQHFRIQKFNETFYNHKSSLINENMSNDYMILLDSNYSFMGYKFGHKDNNNEIKLLNEYSSYLNNSKDLFHLVSDSSDYILQKSKTNNNTILVPFIHTSMLPLLLNDSKYKYYAKIELFLEDTNNIICNKNENFFLTNKLKIIPNTFDKIENYPGWKNEEFYKIALIMHGDNLKYIKKNDIKITKKMIMISYISNGNKLPDVDLSGCIIPDIISEKNNKNKNGKENINENSYENSFMYKEQQRKYNEILNKIEIFKNIKFDNDKDEYMYCNIEVLKNYININYQDENVNFNFLSNKTLYKLYKEEPVEFHKLPENKINMKLILLALKYFPDLIKSLNDNLLLSIVTKELIDQNKILSYTTDNNYFKKGIEFKPETFINSSYEEKQNLVNNNLFDKIKNKLKMYVLSIKGMLLNNFKLSDITINESIQSDGRAIGLLMEDIEYLKQYYVNDNNYLNLKFYNLVIKAIKYDPSSITSFMSELIKLKKLNTPILLENSLKNDIIKTANDELNKLFDRLPNKDRYINNIIREELINQL